MTLFCLLLLTAFLQPPWAVAGNGNGSPGQIFIGGVPAKIAPMPGPMTFKDGDKSVGFIGVDMRKFEDLVSYDTRSDAKYSYNQGGFKYFQGRTQGQTYRPSYRPAGNINFGDPGQEYKEKDSTRNVHSEPNYQDAEYNEAKEDFERAVAFAARMKARCNRRFIQNNYSLRMKCYAEKGQAQAAMYVAKEILKVVEARVESAAHAETTASEKMTQGTINFNKMGKTYNLKLQVRTQNGICFEHWEIGLTRLADKMWEPAFDVKCKEPTGMRNRKNGPNTLLVSNPDDSFCLFSNNPNSMTVIQDGTCIVYQYDNDGNKKSSSELGTKDCDQEKKTMWDLIKAEEEGTSISTDISKDTSNTDTIHFNDFGKTYKLKLQIKTVDGICMEHWEIGLIRLDEKIMEPTFDVKCKDSSGMINRINGPNTLLVSNPDHKFCFFSNNLNSLTVIIDGTCTKYQYDIYGNKKFAIELDTEGCDLEKKTMWDLIKSEYGGAVPNTYNQNDYTPDGASDTGTMNFNDFGKTYKMIIQIKTVDGVCMEHWEIGLTRLDNKMWEPAFEVKCKDSSGMLNRKNGPNTLVVSNPDHKFCFFSNNPNSLTVIKDGTCTTYQYDNDGNKKSSLTSNDCDHDKQTMWDLIKTEEEGARTFTDDATPEGTLFTDIYSGPYYAVKVSDEIRNGEKCNKKMCIVRNVNNELIEKYTFPCSSSVIGCSRDTQEVMVGGPDHNFCAFVTKKMPKSLILLRDGKCQKRTYSYSTTDGDTVNVSTIKDIECEDIKSILGEILKNLFLRNMNGGDSKRDVEIKALNDELVEMVSEPPVPTVPFKKPFLAT